MERRDPELNAAIELSILMSTPDPDRVRVVARWGRISAAAVALVWAAAAVLEYLGSPVLDRVPSFLLPLPLGTSIAMALLGLALVIRPRKGTRLATWARALLVAATLLIASLAVVEELIEPGESTGTVLPSAIKVDTMPTVLLVSLLFICAAVVLILVKQAMLAQWLVLPPLGLGVVLTNAIIFDPHALAGISLFAGMSILVPPTLVLLPLSVLMQTSAEGFVARGMGSDEGSRLLRRNFPRAVVVLIAAMFIGFELYGENLVSRAFGFGVGTGLVIFVGGVLVWIQSSRFYEVDMRRRGAEHVMQQARQALAERDTMARRLGTSQQRLRRVLDSSIDAYVAIDDAGMVTEWNEAATRMFGWTYSEAIHTPLDSMIIPPDKRQAHRDGIATYLSTGEARVIERAREFTAVRKDGRPIEVELRVWPLQEGDETHFHAFIRDITEQHRARTELLQANRELEEFAAVAAHDLRSPLVAIGLTAELIAQQESEGHSEATVDWANRIIDATRRGNDLINDLIALSQVSSSERSRELIAVDSMVRQIADEVVSAFPREASVNIGRLPSIRGDQILIRQLFHNLITNALKYVPGDRSPQVEVDGTVGPTGEIRFTIRDNGEGVPAEDLHRVFDMFHRGSNSTGSSGSGIGLAICRRVVERHEGTISVCNPAGGGAQFEITFPGPPGGGLQRI